MLTHFNNLTTKIETGDHICFLNETESDLRTALSHQISQGLERDEKLLYISQANNLESIQILLKDIGVNANDYLQSGQLEIINWVDFYYSEGTFDSNKLAEYFFDKVTEIHRVQEVLTELADSNQKTLTRMSQLEVDEICS